MRDEAYKAKMDVLTAACRNFGMMTSTISDGDLATMHRTLDLAGAAGHLFVKPLDYPAAMERTRQQRRLLYLLGQFREVMDELHPDPETRTLYRPAEAA